MKIEHGKLDRNIVIEICEAAKNKNISTHFFLQEYNQFKMTQHFNLLENRLMEAVNENSLYVNICDKANKQAWAIISIVDYDSLIFGFDVASIDYLITSENFKIGIDELFKQIIKLTYSSNIKYLTLSLNTNDTLYSEYLNIGIRRGFKYISTLLIFGTNKSDHQKLDLDFTYDDGITVRTAKDEDFEALFEIANSSFKLDKYHLDSYLPQDKCDKLYSESFRNSFFNGFVDKILVADYKGIPIGYSSIKVKKINELNISFGLPVIAAVSKKYRGMGAYKAMEKERITYLNKVADISEFGTYINNASVHSVLIKSKMKLIKGQIQMSYIVK